MSALNEVRIRSVAPRVQLRHHQEDLASFRQERRIRHIDVVTKKLGRALESEKQLQNDDTCNQNRSSN